MFFSSPASQAKTFLFAAFILCHMLFEWISVIVVLFNSLLVFLMLYFDDFKNELDGMVF